MTGSETITYHNRSPDTLGEVWLNLPQNVFAPGNPRDRAAPVTGGFESGARGGPGDARGACRRPEAPRRCRRPSASRFPHPIPPGGTAELTIDWSFVVPEGTFRMGREGTHVYYLAQWYPQVAVYDDLRGWARDPYLGDGEFYLEYGDFDVEITAPAGWLVSASGVLQNSGEVLDAPGDRAAGHADAQSRDPHREQGGSGRRQRNCRGRGRRDAHLALGRPRTCATSRGARPTSTCGTERSRSTRTTTARRAPRISTPCTGPTDPTGTTPRSTPATPSRPTRTGIPTPTRT